MKKLPQFISHARNILPSNVPIQIPPNLVCPNRINSSKELNCFRQNNHKNGNNINADAIKLKNDSSSCLENMDIKNKMMTDKNGNENGNENCEENRARRDGEYLLHLLTSGASDLGGISPHDEVNPSYRFQRIESIKSQLRINDFHLVERLPVYEHHFSFLSDKVKRVVDKNYNNFYNQ